MRGVQIGPASEKLQGSGVLEVEGVFENDHTPVNVPCFVRAEDVHAAKVFNCI